MPVCAEPQGDGSTQSDPQADTPRATRVRVVPEQVLEPGSANLPGTPLKTTVDDPQTDPRHRRERVLADEPAGPVHRQEEEQDDKPRW